MINPKSVVLVFAFFAVSGASAQTSLEAGGIFGEVENISEKHAIDSVASYTGFTGALAP